VRALCSAECAGREAGSREGQRARHFIIDELRAAGVSAEVQPVPGCRGANVIASLPRGRDNAGRTVLVGAHYDHLGRAMGGEAYWGADDNAAAVALLLELAHRLARSTPALPGQVILAFFDGEEPPHFLTSEMGSMHFVDNPTVPLETIDLAIILDLIGHKIGPEDAPPAVRNTLFALGAEKCPGLSELVRGAAAGIPDLWVRPLDIDVIPPLSDYEPFRRRSLPFLFLSCGRWRHYHEVTDTPDRVAYDKVASATSFVESLARAALHAPSAPGRYDHSLRGGRETLATLIDLSRSLAPVLPHAGAALAEVEAMAERLASDGALSDEDWATVRRFIAVTEGDLG
jgi:hypothetical protein